MSLDIVKHKKQEAYVSHVEKDGIFFVQLDTSESAALHELSDRIAQHVKSASSQNICPAFGLKCFARSNTDNIWYRALIVGVDNSKVTVFFVDYGNIEIVSFEQLRDPVDSLFNFCYQCVCCVSANFSPKHADFDLKLKSLILDREVFCVFLSQNKSKGHPFLRFLPCYNVLLYKDSKSDSTLTELLVGKNLGAYAICADNAEIDSEQNVIVSFVDSPGKFWVQLSGSVQVLEKLMNDLNSPEMLLLLTSLPEASIDNGVVCCAQYSEDLLFYRAEISGRKSSTKVDVWFGDFGNSQVVATKDLKILPQQFTRLPFCALMCSLDGVLPVHTEKPHPRLGNIAWAPEACKSFSSLASDKEFKARIVNELSPDVYTVCLFDLNTGSDVRTMLSKQGFVELSVPSVQNIVGFNSISLSVGKTYKNILVTHAESPAVVWCQLPQYQEEMEALTNALESVATILPVLENVEIGSPCCAQYSEDNAWYRGTVEDVDSLAGTALVRFVDYGNCEEVQLMSLKALSNEYFVLSAQAISFSMDSLAPINDDDWSVQACELFLSLVQEKEFNCAVVCLDADGFPSVNLFDPLDPNENIGHHLITQGLAVKVPPSSDSQPLKDSKQGVCLTSEVDVEPIDFDFLSFQVGKSYEKIFITHVESPAVVWCQLPRYQEEMEALSSALETVAPSLPALQDIEVGIPCCAQYSVDNAWYRGTVESINPLTETAQVLFVDYGNSEEVQLTCLKALSKDFFSLPAQAISFSLYSVTSTEGEWSVEACQYFISRMYEKVLDCSVVCLDADGYPSVNLKDSVNPAEDITQPLVQHGWAVKLQPVLSEEPQPVASPRNEGPPVEFKMISLKVGNLYSNIVITHVESPAIVWCQLPQYREEMESLATALESDAPTWPSLENIEVGIPCCAQYSVDDAWYRCTVQSVDSENGTAEVLFVDYGNTDKVPLTNLKSLSSECIALPAQGVSFSIQTIAPNENDWNQEACTFFENLVLEKELSCAVIALDADGYPSVKLCDPQNSDQDICLELVKQGYATELCVNKEAVELQSRNPTSLLKPPSLSQLLDFDFLDFEVGKSYDGIFITHVESPTVVWCQLPKYQEEMEALSASLESVASSLPALEHIEVGVPCCAQYSVDNVWYRGTIDSVNTTTQTAQVLFVDYGNTEELRLTSLKALSSDYFTLPAQAIRFSIADVISPTESEWSKDCCEFFTQLVHEKEMTCKVVKIEDGNYPSVLLFDSSSINVAQELVRCGYAKHCHTVSSKDVDGENTQLVPSGAQVSNPKIMAEKKSSLSYNPISLMVGSVHSVIVCYIESLTEFYCQLIDSSSDLEDLMEDIYRHCESSNFLEKCNDNLVAVGQPIIATFSKDGGWYRALVLKSQDQGALVKYVDYGNCESVGIQSMKKIPKAFVKLPIQAIHCSLNVTLQSDCKFDATTKFQELALDRCFTLSVDGFGKDGQLIVGLTCEDGTTVANLCGLIDIGLDVECFSEESNIPPPVFVANSPTSVVPCFIESPHKFYLQLTENYELLKTFIDSIDGFYKTHDFDVPKQSIGCIYAVQFSEDRVWYRARITIIHNDEIVDVKFLDYGNSETTTMKAVRPLHSKFMSTPCFAVPCFLDGLPKDVSAIDTDTFLAMISDQELVAEFSSHFPDSVSPVAVKLTCRGVNIVDSLLQESVSPHERVLIPKLPSPEFNTPFACVISFVASCEEFYCHLSQNEEEFEELMSNLYAFYGENKGTVLELPTLGSYCAAPFGDDGSWYRGIITNLNECNASVFYSDYGNSGEVELSDLMKLEVQFCSLPVQALLCCLPQQFWNAICSEIFQSMFEQTVELTIVEQRSNGSYMTNLKFNGEAIDSIFGTSSTLASPSNPNVQTVVPNFDSPLPVVVTSIVSCAEFFCQLVANSSEFELLMNELFAFYSESGESQVLASPDVGCMCATTFGADGSWYRARITDIFDDKAQVFYVDYGNSDLVALTDLRKLESQFYGLPQQALKCFLKNLPFVENESSIAVFHDLVLQQESEALFEPLVKGDCYSISMLLNGQSVADMLLKYAPVRLSNVDSAHKINFFVLEPGSTCNVLVTVVNSPEFYCQVVDVEQKLDALMLDIRSHCKKSSPCGEWYENEYVLARFIEDAEWYRAQIIDLRKDCSSVKVFFVDYGNFDTVECSELRKIIPELCELPAQALKCCLEDSQASGKSADQWNELLLNQELKISCVSLEDTNTHVVSFPQKIHPVPELESAIATLQIDSSAYIARHDSEEPGLAQEDQFPYPSVFQPTPGEGYSMFVSHIHSPSQFWLQNPTAVDVLAVLQRDLQEAYEGKENDLLVNTSGACCAKYSEDDCWYRAIVRNQLEEGLEICFIDFGNSEIVDYSSVYNLQQKFYETPVQAIECSMSEVVNANFSNETLTKFSDQVVNRDLCVTFDKKVDVNKWKVSVFDSGKNVADTIFEPASSSKDVLGFSPQVSIKSLDINVGETYAVYIAFSDSPSKFFCQLKSECEKLELLMSNVSEYYNRSTRVEPELLPGSFCVAQYPDPGLWYRAHIVSVHSNADIEVNFVDYGNCEHVCANQVSALVEEFALLSAQGILCSLLHDYNLEFTSDVLQQFFQYDLNQEFKIKIRAFHEERYIVDLYDQEGSHINASVLGLLISPSRMTPVDTQHYIPALLDVGSTVQAYVSHIESPTSFYCQPLHQAAELECLMNDIAKMPLSVNPSLIVENIFPGFMCLVQYSEDNEWYRAVVTNVENSLVTVRFVDYGNMEVSSADKIMEMPEHLQSCITQAVHCSVFEGIDSDMNWSEEQTSEFRQQISQSDHIAMKITSISSRGQYVVEINTNGNSIDFSSLLQQQVEGSVLTPLRIQNSLAVGASGMTALAIEGSVASSTSIDSGSEGGDTESDSESVGKPLIKAPYKLSLAVHESLEVNVVFVHSPSLLYVQRADCKAILESLSEEIKQYCSGCGDSLKAFSLNFRQGDYVLAKHSIDDQWYRAEVTSVDSKDGTTEVSFIDYGNTEVIPSDDLILCPENILELPAQAIPCSLAQVPRRDSWPFEYKELIHQLVDNKVLRATVILPASQGMRPTVKLENELTHTDLSDQVLVKLQEEFENDSNDVITELSEEEDSEVTSSSNANRSDIPTLSTPEVCSNEVKLQERMLEAGTMHAVSVIRCISPLVFYCHLSNEAELLESITSQLSQLPCDFLKTAPKKGDVLAAQFSEDNLWYRARVENVDMSGLVQVTYIDYGNSQTVALENLQFLTKSLLAYYPLAVQCFLANVQVNCSKTEEAIQKFSDIVGSDEVNILVSSVDDASHHSVILTTAKGFDVGNVLVEAQLASAIESDKNIFPHCEVQSDSKSLGKLATAEMNVIPPKEVCSEVNVDTADSSDVKLSQAEVEGVGPQCATGTLTLNEEATIVDDVLSCEAQSCLVSKDIDPFSIKEAVGNTNNNNSIDGYVSTAVFSSLSPAGRYRAKVSHLFSPDDFTCILTENDGTLKQFAAEVADNDSLPVTLTIFSGMPVGVLSQKYNEWCRAKVLSKEISSGIIELYLVDKGDIEMAELSKLKFLTPKHVEDLPPQALRCRLSGLCERDVNSNKQKEVCELKWPVCSGDHLRLLVNRSELFVEICSISDNDIYEVTLLDCTCSHFLNIRQLLLEKLREEKVSPLHSICSENSLVTTCNATSQSEDEFRVCVEAESVTTTPSCTSERDLISFDDVGQGKKLMNPETIAESNKCFLLDGVPCERKTVALKPSMLSLTSFPTSEETANSQNVSESDKVSSASNVKQNNCASEVSVVVQPSMDDK